MSDFVTQEQFRAFADRVATEFAVLTGKVDLNTETTAKAKADFDKAVCAKVAQLGIRPEPVKLNPSGAKAEESKEISKLQQAVEIHREKLGLE